MSNNSKNLATKVVNDDYSTVVLPTKYKCRKNLTHIVRGIHSEFIEVPFIENTKMVPSRTDQSYNRPMSQVILEFERAGRTLADIRASQAQFDFEDGKDDGRQIGIARRRNIEFEDVNAYQKAVDASLSENLEKDIKKKAEKVSAETSASAPDVIPSDTSSAEETA